jgi:hypothetical protein
MSRRLSGWVPGWLRWPQLDLPLTAALGLLLAFGLFVLYSASGGSIDSVYRQGLRIGIGLLALLVLSQVPPHVLRIWTPWLYALGMLLLLATWLVGTGTARVEVRAIDPATWDGGTRVASSGAGAGGVTGASHAAPQQTAAGPGEATWLQAGAYGRRDGAEELADRLRRADLAPVSINDSDNLFRVWLGPYGSHAEAESVILKAIELGFERPHRVSR